MDFEASWSSGVRFTTIGVTVLLAVVVSIAASSGTPLPVMLLVAGLALLTIGFSWLFAPQRYELTGGTLRIIRPIGAAEIPVSAINEARRATDEEMHGTIRIFGNGGLFGIYGWMYNRQLGRHLWYGTRRGNFVLIETVKRKVILTPDEPDRLLTLLKAANW